MFKVKLLSLLRKSPSSNSHRVRLGGSRPVVAPYLYAKLFVIEKWGRDNIFLHYFTSKSDFIPLKPTINFLVKKVVSYEDILEFSKRNRTDYVVVEKDILSDIFSLPPTPPFEEFIIVLPQRDSVVEESLPIVSVHIVEVNIKEIY